MFKIIFGLVAALSFGHTQAQPVPATDPIPRVVFPLTHSGNVSTFGARTADAANAAKFSFGVASNGAIFANTTDRLPTPGGASIPVGVNGTIPKPNVAAAIGRFARKVLPPLALGHALYDLGEELGFGLDNSSGSLVVTRDTPPPAGYDGREWREQTFSGPYSKTRQQACEAFAAYRSEIDYPHTPGHKVCHDAYFQVGSVDVFGANRFQINLAAGGFIQAYTFVSRVDPSPPSADPQPSTIAEFEGAVSARSSWSSDSALARAMVDAIRAGETPLVQPQTVTGPATSPGPVSQTHDATNNTTTLSAATHNYTYAGPNVSVTTVTNTSVINNTTSEVISETETVDSPVTPERPSTDPQKLEFPCGASPLPPCNVKVDETGVPAEGTAAVRFGDANTSVDGTQSDAEGAINDVSDISLPSWSWTFSFPTGCTPLVLPAFGDLEIDVCQFQPVIHDLMSVLWVIAGIWGLINLFMRTTGAA